MQRTAVPDVLRSGGRPLNSATRADMESRLGADFSDVRVHDDSAARRSAAELGARAYTSGSHVVIGDGGHDRHTLAHELTHVIQQRQGPIAGTDNGDGPRVSDPSDRFEREAEANATHALAGPAPARLMTTEPTDQPRADLEPAGPGAAIQRAMYLDNHDRRIYKNEGDPDSSYAFLSLQPDLGAIYVDFNKLETYRQTGNAALLGAFYAYDTQQQQLNILEPAEMGRAYRGLLGSALRTGPQLYQTGGGSRLPDPNGIMFSFGLSRERSFEILGIPPAEQGSYENVQFQQFATESRYQHFVGVMSNETPNHYNYTAPGGEQLFYASLVEQVRNAQSHRVRTGNVTWSDEQFAAIDPNSPQAEDLHRQFSALTRPTESTGWILGTNIAAVDRGNGQDSAMGNWNALAAAAYTNKFLNASLPLTSNWEWLHIRGAQLGGRTEGGNLVAGVYAANSAMIPWENRILQWAQQDPHHFQARFSIDPAPRGPFANQIHLHIMATDHQVLGNLPEILLASFDPFTGNVVDKLSERFLERAMDARGYNEF